MGAARVEPLGTRARKCCYFRGYISLLKSWHHFNGVLQSHGVDFRTTTPEHITVTTLVDIAKM